MTTRTVSRFSRQNDVGLRALNVALRENLVLVVVLVLESKALYYPEEDYFRFRQNKFLLKILLVRT